MTGLGFVLGLDLVSIVGYWLCTHRLLPFVIVTLGRKNQINTVTVISFCLR